MPNESSPGYTSAPSDGEIVEAEIVEDQSTTETSPGRPTGMRTDDGRGNGPGTGLMTMEEANRLAHEANLRAGVYDKW